MQNSKPKHEGLEWNCKPVENMKINVIAAFRICHIQPKYQEINGESGTTQVILIAIKRYVASN